MHILLSSLWSWIVSLPPCTSNARESAKAEQLKRALGFSSFGIPAAGGMSKPKIQRHKRSQDSNDRKLEGATCTAGVRKSWANGLGGLLGLEAYLLLVLLVGATFGLGSRLFCPNVAISCGSIHHTPSSKPTPFTAKKRFPVKTRVERRLWRLTGRLPETRLGGKAAL